MTTTPQAVSRSLHRLGYPTVPLRGWEGIHVSRSGNGALIAINLTGRNFTRELALEITERLTGQGYSVRPNPADNLLLTVTKGSADA